MDKEEFRRRRAAIKAKSDKLWDDIEEHRTEEKRVINVLHNAESILETFVSKWATNSTQPSLDMLIKIAKVLEVELTDLVRIPKDE